MSAAVRPPAIGERLPEFFRPDENQERFSPYERLCGRPAAVAFAADPEAAAPELRSFALFLEANRGVSGAAVLRLTPNRLAAIRETLGPRLLLAADDGRVLQACLGGDSIGPVRFVALDPRLRIAAIADSAAGLAEIFAAMPAEPSPAPHRTNTAPVLVVPDVLDSGLRRELMSAFERQNYESGLPRMADGKHQLVPDPRAKLRRDHTVEDPALTQQLTDVIGRRVLPEIQKSFYYQVTRFERFKVVCYEEGRGYFRPHRDNTTPDVAHRRFAMTLNLNTGEYEGGCLRFPEYGPELYEPAAGGAIVFSCAHLHEATDVTAGRRFALLTFFYGEDAARRER